MSGISLFAEHEREQCRDCYLSFSTVGFALLEGLHKMLGLSFVPDWLMRLSQVTGAVCAFYPGLSGLFVWEHQDRRAGPRPTLFKPDQLYLL